MKECKFNIGDRVRILPNATRVSVSKRDIGKEGQVIEIYSWDSMIIDMGNRPWWVSCDMVESAIPIGKQLLFWPED